MYRSTKSSAFMRSEGGAFPVPTRAPRSLFWLGEARGCSGAIVEEGFDSPIT